MTRFNFMSGKAKALVCGCLIFFTIGLPLKSIFPTFSASAGSDQAAFANETVLPGYRSAAYANGCFLVVGTNGRLDKISPDKKVEKLSSPASETNLTDIWSDGEITLVTGENATILYSSDYQQFYKCEIGINSDIFGLTYFNGIYLACAENGVVLTSGEGKQWSAEQLPTEHDIVSIAANHQYIMAVTRESDILISTDGQNWQHENFNTTYKGYYDPYLFSSIIGIGETFFIFGQLSDEPGRPVILYSDTGEVWTQQPLAAINEQMPENSFPLTLNAVAYDADQMLAACDKGRLLTITNCAVCNELTEISDKDLCALAYGDGKLLAAGADFYFEILDSAQVRQSKIEAEQAFADFQNGAVIIDVRTDSELEQDGYIAGSIHIPLAEIRDKLTQAVPDRQKELIFYCAKGVRAQQALEAALELGYECVYNLGGLTDWPYDITK